MTMNEILDLPLGLMLGLINEKNNNQMEENVKDKDEVIQGDAKMLMNM